jgi:hypothetical protein
MRVSTPRQAGGGWVADETPDSLGPPEGGSVSEPPPRETGPRLPARIKNSAAYPNDPPSVGIVLPFLTGGYGDEVRVLPRRVPAGFQALPPGYRRRRAAISVGIDTPGEAVAYFNALLQKKLG